MKILNLITNRGYKTSHSGTYLDPYKNIDREFDIRASKKIGDGKYIKLAMECKNISDDYPFIVHSVLAKKNDKRHSILLEFEKFVKKNEEETGQHPLDQIIKKNFETKLKFNLISYELSERRIDQNTTLYSHNKDLEFIGKSIDLV